MSDVSSGGVGSRRRTKRGSTTQENHENGQGDVDGSVSQTGARGTAAMKRHADDTSDQNTGGVSSRRRTKRDSTIQENHENGQGDVDRSVSQTRPRGASAVKRPAEDTSDHTTAVVGGKKKRDSSSQENHENGENGADEILDQTELEEDAAMKRSADDTSDSPTALNSDSPSKRRKMGPPQPKNPISTLNELRPGLEYKTDSVGGPSHAPLFTVTIDLNGQIFKGTGRSKKQAKHSAAETTLRSFLQFRNASDAAQALGIDSSTAHQDFTTDVSEVNFNANEANGDEAATPETNNNTNGTSTGERKSLKRKRSSSSESPAAPGATSGDASNQGPSQTSKNPIMLLNELRQGVEYQIMQESGEPHAKTFAFRVTVDGQAFEGTGNSKKLAKAAAARQALSKLYGVIASTPSTVLHHMPISNMPNFHMNQTMADKIAKLVCDKFMELTAGNPTLAKRKVLAGIVMTNDANEDDIRVISCSTGTKCINGEHLSLQGQCINDCHAEIISRRCLVNYLYTHIGKFLDSVKDGKVNKSIIEAREEGVGYKVKPQYKFHLYINTAPCGDARIFAPHEEEADRADKHPNRQSRGLLRTKIESGEGTIPIKTGTDTIQTWDGVLQGERLRTMSCSDKVARWNVVGLQGSLLSHFLTPVYLESVVLGSLFNASHMYRAVCGRIEHTVQGLPPPFKLNQPKMNQGSSTESRQPQKAPTISVNWDCEDQQMEVLNAMTGRQEGEMSSRLCKRQFLKRLITLLDHPAARPLTGVDPGAVKQSSYGEVKALSTDYQASKKALHSAFSKAGLGKWISKPMEEDLFYLD